MRSVFIQRRLCKIRPEGNKGGGEEENSTPFPSPFSPSSLHFTGIRSPRNVKNITCCGAAKKLEFQYQKKRAREPKGTMAFVKSSKQRPLERTKWEINIWQALKCLMTEDTKSSLSPVVRETVLTRRDSTLSSS